MISLCFIDVDGHRKSSYHWILTSFHDKNQQRIAWLQIKPGEKPQFVYFLPLSRK
jgi:hypothetical protein